MKATNIGATVLGSLLFAAAVPTTALADVVTFTFEGLATQSGLTTLTLTGTVLSATLTRSGTVFSIADESPLGVPTSWGSRSLDPFDNTGTAPFLLNFSQAITGLQIEMGDFGDDANLLTLQLFSGLNGTGTLLGTSNILLPVGGDTFHLGIPTLSTTAALSAKFIGGSTDFPNSVYYDNIRATFTPATVTPEPGTIALLATGFVGLGIIRRKKRSAA